MPIFANIWYFSPFLSDLVMQYDNTQFTNYLIFNN